MPRGGGLVFEYLMVSRITLTSWGLGLWGRGCGSGSSGRAGCGQWVGGRRAGPRCGEGVGCGGRRRGGFAGGAGNRERG